MSHLSRRARLVALVLSSALAIPDFASAAEITVCAAPSQKAAMDAVAADREKAGGNRVVISDDRSDKLAKQGQVWPLADAKLIKAKIPKTIVENKTILATAGPSAAKANVAVGFDLAFLVGKSKLAEGLVHSVPAGQYGHAAQADTVRPALKLLHIGQAAHGIADASDTVSDDKVVGTFPEDSHKPIAYPAAATASGTMPQAPAFLADVSSDAAVAIFTAQGFIVLTYRTDARCDARVKFL